MVKHQDGRHKFGVGNRLAQAVENGIIEKECAFLGTVLDIMDALLLVADLTGRIVLFNQACEKLTGYRASEVIGKNVFDLFILPEEKANIRSKVVDKLLGEPAGEPVTYQNYWLAKDGSKLFISWSNSLLCDDAGTQYIVCSGIDLTAHRSIQQALEHSEQLFTTLFEQANDAIFLAEVLPDGSLSNYLQVNEQACRKLGYSHEEFKQLSPHTLPIIEMHERKAEIDKCIDSGNAIWDLTMITKDDRKVQFELNAHTFPANDKMYCLAICRDISERKKAEQVLKESEERYRNLVELSPDAIFVHRNCRFIYANTATANLFGVHSPTDLIGRPFAELIHPDYEEQVNARLDALERGEKVEGVSEGKVLRYDGVAVEVDFKCSVFTYHGQPAVQVIMRDISGRKKMEQEVLKASKLHSLGTLSGSMAHEYNNLLTVILGNVSIARMYAGHESKATEILQEVEDAAQQARELTQRLLTFARGGSPVKKVLNLRSLLFKKSLDILEDGGIDYSLKILGDLLPLEADEGQICQAMNDIMLNAVQAMPHGGTVNIVAENVTSQAIAHLFPTQEGLYVKVSISDEGPGIAEKEITNIFDPFYSTKPDCDGMGLSTAYSIINKHGGHLTVESVEGEGATFIIYLPAIQSMKLPQEEEDQVINGSGKVLVMDDEPAIRKTVQEMLMLLGYEAVTASDGAQALNLYQEAMAAGPAFDAVILDLMVADGVGGKETISKLRELDPEVKAYVSSGYSNDPIISNYSNYGFSGCIPKPYTIEQLGAALK